MLSKLNKYGGFNSYDFLKSIAIITMIIDHLGLFFYPEVDFLRLIGRISYPLFAFCIGYNKKYHLDSTLIVLAIIMCLSHLVLWPDLKSMIRGSILKASILPSIIILRFSMQYITKYLNSKNMYLWAFVLWLFASYTTSFFQYGTSGIILAICGYLSISLKNNQDYKIFLYINLILYAGFQAILFKASLSSLCVLIFEFLIMAKILKDFSIKPISIIPPLATILLPASRYALIIYFVHSEIFKLISVIS